MVRVDESLVVEHSVYFGPHSFNSGLCMFCKCFFEYFVFLIDLFVNETIYLF